jgi:hypothetical protein
MVVAEGPNEYIRSVKVEQSSLLIERPNKSVEIVNEP